MIFSTIYLQAYLGMLEHTFAYMERFHPAYGGWARLMKYHRTGSWH